MTGVVMQSELKPISDLTNITLLTIINEGK